LITVERTAPRRRLLVLGAGAGQLGLLEAARERGLFVTAVDRDPSAAGFRHADRRAIVSLDDEPALERLAEAGRVEGVIAPGSDVAVGAAARIAARLGLPHPLSPVVAVPAASRLRRRERLAEAGVPQIGWKVVKEPDGGIGLPCLVAPADRQGPRGRSVVRSARELAAAVETAREASRSGLCLIEELGEGPEVRVTAFSLGGVFRPLTVTDRLPDCVVWPSNYGEQTERLAERAALALAIDEGPSTTRIRLTADGPRVVGLSARLGGAHDAELCLAAVGVDLNALALAAAFGEPVEPKRLEPRPRVGGACVRFVATPGIEPYEVDGSAEAERATGVEWVRLYRGRERAGAVLATGRSPGEAQTRATRAAQGVRFSPVDAQAVA
jgi:biotin carboxylase